MNRPPRPLLRLRALLRDWRHDASLLLVTALGVTLTLAASAYHAAALREQAIEAGLRDTALISKSFVQQVTQTLSSTAFTLDHIAESLDEDNSPDQVEGLLGLALQNNPALRSVSLLDADLRIRASTNTAARGQRLSLGALLPTPSEANGILRVGTPRSGRDVDQASSAAQAVLAGGDAMWWVPVTWTHRKGKTVITLLAAMNVDFFRNHFHAIAQQEGARADLIRYDGLVLASTDDAARIGVGLTDPGLVAAMQAKDYGSMRLRQPDGADPAILSYAVSRLYPLAVVARIAPGELLRGWHAEVRTLAAVIIPLSALALVLAALSTIGSRRALRERQKNLAALKLAASVYQNASEAIFITDPDNRIVSVNPAFTAVTGYSAGEAIGQRPSLLRSGRNPATLYQAIWQSLKESDSWSGEIWNRRKDGETYAEWLNITAVRDHRARLVNYIAMFFDITEKKQADELIWRQANYDVLCGIPNRRLFLDRLEEEIKRCQRHGNAMAVLFLDLDHFKEINDTLGHECGDQLLRQAARRIVSCVRNTDTVARLGGDEFALLLPELVEKAAAGQVAANIVRALAQPFVLDGQSLHVSASVGLTLFPDDGNNSRDLLSNADQAMYEAKREGRNRYHYFTPEMHRLAQARQRLLNELHGALARGEFEVVYQPILHLATGQLRKAEALLRWNSAKLGNVPPANFIPLAEEAGLIDDIGRWAASQAVELADEWHQARPPGPGQAAVQVSINKSPRQFSAADSWVVEEIRRRDLSFDCVAVEITEGLLMEDRPAIHERLLRFQEMGVQVALDDFGTGYSTLSYLQRFHIDYLKIDRSFVTGMVGNPHDRVIVEAMVAMAHKLGIAVIAEGVENEAQLALLRELDCDYAQGFLISTPLPRADFARFCGFTVLEKAAA